MSGARNLSDSSESFLRMSNALADPALRQAGDEKLVRMARLGNKPALAELVRRWQGPLITAALPLLAYRRHDAEEAVQEAWLSICRALPSLRDCARWKAWAFRILRNVCLTRRRRDRNQPDNLEQCPDPPAEMPVEETDEVLQQRLKNCIPNMPKAYRDSVDLRYRKRKPYREIAKKLGISIGAAKSNVFRGLLWLEKTLGNPEHEHE